MRLPVNTFLVNTGEKLVLLDAGGAKMLGPTAGRLPQCLAAAGIDPAQIDEVYITHMHGDHIGGLMGEAGPTFARARYVTGAVEHNHWSGAANEGFDTKVKPLNDKMTFLDDGGTVAPGITALAAFGHSCGGFSAPDSDQRGFGETFQLAGFDNSKNFGFSFFHRGRDRSKRQIPGWGHFHPLGT